MKLKNKIIKGINFTKFNKISINPSLKQHLPKNEPIYNEPIYKKYCLILYFEGKPFDFNYICAYSWNKNPYIDFYIITTEEWYNDWSEFCSHFTNIKLLKSKKLIDLCLENGFLNQESYNKIVIQSARRYLCGLKPFMCLCFDFVKNYENYGWIDHDVVINPSFNPADYITEEKCYKFRTDCGQLCFIKYGQDFDKNINNYISERGISWRYDEKIFQNSVEWITINGGLWVGDRGLMPDNTVFTLNDKLTLNGKEHIFFTPQYYDSTIYCIDKFNIPETISIKINNTRDIILSRRENRINKKITLIMLASGHIYEKMSKICINSLKNVGYQYDIKIVKNFDYHPYLFKTKIFLDCLELNDVVISSDCDIIYHKNIMDLLNAEDMIVSYDANHLIGKRHPMHTGLMDDKSILLNKNYRCINSGFVIANKNHIKILKKWNECNMYLLNNKLEHYSDQASLNYLYFNEQIKLNIIDISNYPLANYKSMYSYFSHFNGHKKRQERVLKTMTNFKDV